MPRARATKMHNFNILQPTLRGKHANFQPISLTLSSAFPSPLVLSNQNENWAVFVHDLSIKAKQ